MCPPTAPHTGAGEPATEVQALDWELNPQPFRPLANTLTTEPNWPGS